MSNFLSKFKGFKEIFKNKPTLSGKIKIQGDKVQLIIELDLNNDVKEQFADLHKEVIETINEKIKK